MSVVVRRDELTEEQVSLIRKFLFLQPKEKFNYGSHHSTPKSDPVLFYSVVEGKGGEKYVFIPYRFSEVLLGENKNLSGSYTPSVFEFTGNLRDYQAEDMPLALGMLEKHGTVSLGVYASYGKCLAPGTEVLMFDGTKKVVEEIEIGDQVMGDDSKPRNILSTTSGEEEMYQIIPTKGESFSVNKSHILTLWASAQGKINKKKTRSGNIVYDVIWFDGKSQRGKRFKDEESAKIFSEKKKTPENRIFDISLNDYLNLKVGAKHILKSFYVPVLYPEQGVPLDPYYLGIWLGDGNSRRPGVTTLDQEVIDYLELFAEENDVIFKQCAYDPITYYLLGKRHGNNPVLSKLKNMNLILNKHIPYVYKRNSREIRLKVLAGLIDSDGSLNGDCCYEIIQKSDKLAYDIQDLCRSLGFACYVRKTTKFCIYKGERKVGEYNRISIYGSGVEDVPVLIPRKKAIKKKRRNALVTGFKVKSLGIGKYHGFTIDGNGRFLLGSFMVTHNTVSAAYLASKYKLLTVVLMHRTTLIKQWCQTFTKFTNARLWIVGEEDKPPIFNVIVCLDERVGKIPVEIRNRVGMMVIDEAHAFCTKKQSPRLLSFHPKYIIALSATLERDDGMHEMIYAMCGDHRITREMKKEFHVYKVDTGVKAIRKERKGGKGVEWHSLAKSLAFNDERNRMIVAMALKNPTHKIVILTGYVNHTKLLHKTLENLGESVDYLCGNKKNYKNSRVLIGTIDKIGTGFDEESFCDDFNGVKINLGILAHSIASKKLLEQSVGRVFRANFPNIFHLVDDDKTIQRHWTNAKRWYKSKGGILHN